MRQERSPRINKQSKENKGLQSPAASTTAWEEGCTVSEGTKGKKKGKDKVSHQLQFSDSENLNHAVEVNFVQRNTGSGSVL